MYDLTVVAVARCHAYHGNKMQSYFKADRRKRHAQILFRSKGRKPCNHQLHAAVKSHSQPFWATFFLHLLQLQEQELQRGRRKATKLIVHSSCLKEIKSLRNYSGFHLTLTLHWSWSVPKQLLLCH